MLVDDNSQIKVSDLKIPEGVKLSVEPEEIIATVSAAREEEPEEVVAEDIDMDAIEVDGKDKAEGEEAEGEEKSAE